MADNLQSMIVNGVWIQEKYSGQVESGKGSGITLTREYQLRKKGDSHLNKTQEMHQADAYKAFQSFILQYQQHIVYQTNEGKIEMWASKMSVDVDRNNYPVYTGKASWIFDPRKPNFLIQPTTWSHRMIGGTRKANRPMGQQRFYTRPGVPPIYYPGVNFDAEKRTFEGVDIYSPEWRIVAKQQLLAGLVTDNYWYAMQSLSKTVNNSPFKGFSPGTVLYLGIESDESFVNDNRVYDITHQFIVEPNLVDFTFDGIPVSRKDGHEYMWFTSHNTADGVITDQVCVAPMYATSNFALIGVS